jgi:hypothetical protein
MARRNPTEKRECCEKDDSKEEGGEISEKKAFHKAEKEDEALHKVVKKAAKKMTKAGK